MSENAQAIYDGYLQEGISETKNEDLKERARQKIYYDMQAERITDEEAEFLYYEFNLD